MRWKILGNGRAEVLPHGLTRMFNRSTLVVKMAPLLYMYNEFGTSAAAMPRGAVARGWGAGKGEAGLHKTGDAFRARAVPAVTRAAAILRLLARSDGGLGVQAIARDLRLIPSTCLHILRALVVEELVTFDPATKQYRLGTGVLALGRKLLKRNMFANLVQEPLQTLAAKRGVTAIGLEARGLDHVVVTAISRSKEPFHIHVDIGSRFPALISASGRCIAAFGGHAESELERRFGLLRWDRAPSYHAWRDEVAQAKSLGYGVDSDQYILGVSVISAPVPCENGVRHLIVAVGLTERLREQTPLIGAELIELAAEIGRRMED